MPLPSDPKNSGWYLDPNGLRAMRWWDGETWGEDAVEPAPPWEGVPGAWELWEADDTVERDGVHTSTIVSPLMPGYQERVAGFRHTWTVEASGETEAHYLINKHLYPPADA